MSAMATFLAIFQQTFWSPSAHRATLINFGYKRHVQTDDELTAFGAIDFGKTSFNRAIQLQDTLFFTDPT